MREEKIDLHSFINQLSLFKSQLEDKFRVTRQQSIHLNYSSILNREVLTRRRKYETSKLASLDFNREYSTRNHFGFL